MHELKKIGKVFTSKFVETGPSSYKKKNLPGRGLTKVEKHCPKMSNISCHQYENLTSPNFALKESCILYIILFLCVRSCSEE